MTANPSYILAGAAAEIERLRHVDEYMAPTTQSRLDRLGIDHGWTCLEVGAGVGGVARWMAEQVGPSGKVVAVDLNPLFDADPHLPNLEIRRHDVLAEGLEPDFYDLVHCRLLLVNVGNPELALERMTSALCPGGWLLVEEPGEARFPAVGESDPRVAEYHRLMDVFLQSTRATARAVDLDLFRRLPSLLESLGLVQIGGEVSSQLVRSKGRSAVLGTIRALRPLLADQPIAKEGMIERLIELCEDPTLLALGESTLCLWGQRPA